MLKIHYTERNPFPLYILNFTIAQKFSNWLVTDSPSLKRAVPVVAGPDLRQLMLTVTKFQNLRHLQYFHLSSRDSMAASSQNVSPDPLSNCLSYFRCSHLWNTVMTTTPNTNHRAHPISSRQSIANHRGSSIWIHCLWTLKRPWVVRRYALRPISSPMTIGEMRFDPLPHQRWKGHICHFQRKRGRHGLIYRFQRIQKLPYHSLCWAHPILCWIFATKMFSHSGPICFARRHLQWI